MVSEESSSVSFSNLATIVGDVFQTMLGLTAEPAGPPWEPEPSSFTAAVHFAGEWTGALLIEVSPAQGRDWTRLLSAAPDSPSVDADSVDALGELANMVGGNLKSLMPRGVGLSMPTVVQGSDYSIRICGNNHAMHGTFRCECGDFRVTVVEVAGKT